MKAMLVEIQESVYSLAKEVYRAEGIDKTKKEIVDSLHLQSGASFSNLLTTKTLLNNLSVLVFYKEYSAAIDLLQHNYTSLRDRIGCNLNFIDIHKEDTTVIMNKDNFSVRVRLGNYITEEVFYLYFDFSIIEISKNFVDIKMEIVDQYCMNVLKINTSFLKHLIHNVLIKLNQRLYSVFNKPARIFSDEESITLIYKCDEHFIVSDSFVNSLMKGYGEE